MIKNGEYYSNYLTPKILDKKNNERKNPTWIKEIKESGKAFIIPIKNDEVLISNSESQDIKLLPIINSESELHFLGKFDDKYLFTTEFSENEFKTNSEYFQSGTFYNIRPIVTLLKSESAALLFLARQLVEWNASNKFCGKCGSATTCIDSGLSRICSNTNCKKQIFPKLSPAIIVLVQHEDMVLLGRQPQWPNGLYSTLAGFVEPAEKVEDTVYREVFEESKIKIANPRYFGSQPWPFPDSLMLGFKADAVTTDIDFENDELEDAKWFTRDEIKEGLKNGTLNMPLKISIAYRLIESWFDEEEGFCLAELVQ